MPAELIIKNICQHIQLNDGEVDYNMINFKKIK